MVMSLWHGAFSADSISNRELKPSRPRALFEVLKSRISNRELKLVAVERFINKKRLKGISNRELKREVVRVVARDVEAEVHLQ